MIGRNSFVKNAENFSERNAKNYAWKFRTITRNRINEKISLSCDVNDGHIHSKSKSVNFLVNLVRNLNDMLWRTIWGRDDWWMLKPRTDRSGAVNARKVYPSQMGKKYCRYGKM